MSQSVNGQRLTTSTPVPNARAMRSPSFCTTAPGCDWARYHFGRCAPAASLPTSALRPAPARRSRAVETCRRPSWNPPDLFPPAAARRKHRLGLLRCRPSRACDAVHRPRFRPRLAPHHVSTLTISQMNSASPPSGGPTTYAPSSSSRRTAQPADGRTLLSAGAASSSTPCRSTTA